MRKQIFILLFILLGISSQGQVLIGLSVAEIKERYSDIKYNFKIITFHIDDVRGDVIAIDDERAELSLYLNSEGVCRTQVVEPYDEEALKYFVELYNKKLEVVSSTEWKAYFDNGVSLVELTYYKNIPPFFVWGEVTQ